jgi:hypothetical protein
VLIQGTSVILNTPEALEVWLAERRKRWPTAERVKEKSVRMEEAIARGQLPPMSSNSRGKKRRHEEHDSQRSGKRFHNEFKRGSRPRTQPTTSTTTPAVISLSPTGTVSPVVPAPVVESLGEEASREEGDDDDDDDDEIPEVLSSKKPINGSDAADAATGTEEKVVGPPKASQTTYKIPRKKEPRLPPRNPFASRPALLRNVRYLLNCFTLADSFPALITGNSHNGF